MKNEGKPAGKPAEPGKLVNVPGLVTAFYTEAPDFSVQALASALEVLAASEVEIMIAM